MRLGIDFGTTRTRLAAVVKGNYPLVTFQTDDGTAADWYPSLIAAKGDRLAFGSRAHAVQYETGWDLLRSIKRVLIDAHPESVVKLGSVEVELLTALTRFLAALRQDLLQHSNLEVGPREKLEVMVGVPANAGSNQRFLTLEAFRRAGFDVIGMLNEPSAAGIEYAFRYRATDITRRREHVVVYDLGGGTFDVAVICMAGSRHDVVASEGISRLGGDDFDELLLELALSGHHAAPGTQPTNGVPPVGWVPTVPRARLLALCREAKESLTPNSRRVIVDFGQLSPELEAVSVPVGDFYGRCQPLIRRSVEAAEAAMHAALDRADGDAPSLAAIYLVGGSCELPILARALRDRFGKRVRRSPYPSGATAIGLAIVADQEGEYVLQERFARHFGVWREAEDGATVVFDPIFAQDTPLPRAGEPPLVIRRRYRPAHNVGRFRFLECSALREDGAPAGDIVAWDEATFPFDPALADRPHLARLPVERMPAMGRYEVEEVYRCDASGIIAVSISNLTTGYSRTYRVR